MNTTPFLYALIFSTFLLSCGGNNCSKFESETYPENDLKIEFEAKGALNTLYGYLGELDYNKSTYESYRLLSGAADALTKSVIRLDHSDNGYTISYKVFTASATPDQDMAVEIVEENVYELSKKDWDVFNSLIYTKSFWTMPEKTGRTGYKGVSYFIEGTRPQAKACNKRTQHMVTRWNPKPGNFEALSTYMETLMIIYKSKHKDD